MLAFPGRQVPVPAERLCAREPQEHAAGMATLDDVRRLALQLPETQERTTRDGVAGWTVKGKGYAWERPLRKADLQALRAAAPTGTVLGVSVADLGVKEALLADDAGAVFTTPHFDGYPAVLMRLDEVDLPELEELVEDAWLARAPKRLAAGYLAARRPEG